MMVICLLFLLSSVTSIVVAEKGYSEDTRSIKSFHETGRRSLTNMKVGAGNDTKFFGGGKEIKKNTVLNSLHLKHYDFLRDTSDGQAIFYVKNILQQIDAYDMKHKIPIKSPRYFIEFGARDGQYESNTKFLEDELKWEGILIDGGRDYIQPLRETRNCIFNAQYGSCIWGALSNNVNKTLYWNGITDQVNENVNVEKYGLPGHDSREKAEPTAHDRRVKTTTLDHLLHHYNFNKEHTIKTMKSIDFLSADCEGCEEMALLGINMEHKHIIDVMTIESPNCNIQNRLYNLDYTAILLPMTYDIFFVTKNIIKKMINKPVVNQCWNRLNMNRDGPNGNCNDRNNVDYKNKLKLVQSCLPDMKGIAKGRTQASYWIEGSKWPPVHLEQKPVHTND